MSELSITYGGLSYLDRTKALETGDVKPQGCHLEFVRFDTAGELFKRQRAFAEFDSSEMSLGNFIMMVARGDPTFVGIPVFPSRQFRHKDIYVNTSSGVEEPQDLKGMHVGVLQYQMTAAIWVRAILQHDYGVRPSDIRWWTGGLTTAGVPAGDQADTYEADLQQIRAGLPDGTSLELIPDTSTLESMLEAGDLAALVTSRPPVAFRAGLEKIRRLFVDYRAVERDFYLRTGFFPIMHVVVLRSDTYETNRWVVPALVEAFARAKELGMQRLRSLGTLAVALPWLAAEIEEVDSIFGGDAFPYGLDRNRRVLEATISYLLEQGLIDRRVGVEELFAPEGIEAGLSG